MGTKPSLLSVFAFGMIWATGIGSMGTAQAATVPVSAKASSAADTWGTIQTSSGLSMSMDRRVLHGQAYVGLWYIEQLFNKSGWPASWNGHSLSVRLFPTLASPEPVTLNASPQQAKTSTLQLPGVTNVNLSQIASIVGGGVSYNRPQRTVRFIQGATSLHAFALDSNRGMPSRPNAFSRHTVMNHRTTSAPITPANSSSAFTAKMLVNGKALPALTVEVMDHVGFVSFSSVQKSLAAVGIQCGLRGSVMDVTGLPVLTRAVNVVSSIGKGTTTTLIQLNSDLYVPLQALPSVGFRIQQGPSGLALSQVASGSGSSSSGNGGSTNPSNSVNVSGLLEDSNGHAVQGEASFEDAAGQLFTVDSDSNGQFQSTLHGAVSSGLAQNVGSNLALVGTYTPANGWVTQYATSRPVNGTIPPMTIDAEANQLFTTVSGHIAMPTNGSQAFSVQEISVRNVITQTHYYAPVDSQGNFSMQLPVGPYEVFALVTSQTAIYSLQPFVATPSASTISIALPSPPTNGAWSTPHSKIVAGDANVSPEDLVSVGNVFEHVYPLDQSALHMSEQGPITITLYSTSQLYEQHFISEGYDSQTASQIAQDSAAVTEGPESISVPMSSFGEVDAENVLAHELTHALVATESLQIPSWANEGLAWHQGILGQMDQSPSQLLRGGAEWTEWEDIVNNQKNNSLQSLGTAGPLTQGYNVEDQDYYAMENLMSQYGMTSVLNYVYGYDHDTNAFQDVFHTTFPVFSQQVTDSLTKQSQTVDKGFDITFKVLTGGPSDVYLENNKGTRIMITGIEPNQTYTLQCSPKGQVTAPAGLTLTSANTLSQAVEGDWYLGTGVTDKGTLESPPDPSAPNQVGAGYRQEFEIANEFGVAYLVRALLYDAGGTLLHSYPTIGVPSGIELVSLTPIQ